VLDAGESRILSVLPPNRPRLQACRRGCKSFFINRLSHFLADLATMSREQALGHRMGAEILIRDRG